MSTPTVLYNVHSRMAHSMWATLTYLLGLYIDENPPVADDWPSPTTKWDPSTIIPFGHNLLLVGLKCDDPEHPNKVLFMHNERIISMAGICGEEICPLEVFLDTIQPIVDVDFEKVCASVKGLPWPPAFMIPEDIFY